MSSMQFKITGLDCAEEVAVLKKELGDLVGGEDCLAFDILNAKMIVTPKKPIQASDIVNAVAKTGMRAEEWSDAPPPDETYFQRHQKALIAVASFVFLLVGFSIDALVEKDFMKALNRDESLQVPVVVHVFYGLSILSALWLVLPKAWLAVRRVRPDMNLLMVVAVAGAIAIGEWLEAATVSFLFALSLALEAWSVGRARRAIAALMELTTPTVRLRDEQGNEREIPVKEATVGVLFIVKPGEKVPLDGEVQNGKSELDQSPVTGESMPVNKNEGDTIYAGSINGSGLLTVKATRLASDTVLAGIIRIVGDAQSKRAPSEQWVEKFAAIYTPLIFLIAVAVAVVPPLAMNAQWSDWVYRALVLLVIGCPCALVISTPVSIVAALTASAKQGVLVKGGGIIEIPAHLEALAFDKTGTITKGAPAVVRVIPLADHDEKELIDRAAALEANSEHPFAAAVLDYAKKLGVRVTPASNFNIIKGKGATGLFANKEFWLGSPRYLVERKQNTPEVDAQLQQLSEAGQSVMLVGNNAHVCGIIVISDPIRPDARNAIRALRESGIKHLVMLSGDNKKTAQSIGWSAGIDEIHAELLPEEKVAAIEELLSKYKNVGMVGDGVNDAPALARASLGIAMGSSGTDATKETADVALISDDLTKIAWLVNHSRRTLSIIRQNVVFSLTVKALFVVLTFFGYSSLWAAISADTGASLLVVLNALRLTSSAEN
ncbi:heavy metal translocating P-type ATPase [Oscillatoria laete-virens NRMC-F 0139]|nr:heavy metal translocating P-type ATPase [Oscillatoria laete-virens]MDL5055720.1 heavy metal translocating P-type ATPase [Oscillatoria laete-virens NRMC-F 0139]